MTLHRESCEVEAVERLLLHRWPHNVRGLATCLTRVRDIDPTPGLHLWSVERVLGVAEPPPSSESVSAAEVETALAACEGNESRAARHLGISRGKLRRILGKA